MSGKLDDFLSDIEVEANTRGREAVQGRDGWCLGSQAKKHRLYRGDCVQSSQAPNKNSTKKSTNNKQANF